MILLKVFDRLWISKSLKKVSREFKKSLNELAEEGDLKDVKKSISDLKNIKDDLNIKKELNEEITSIKKSVEFNFPIHRAYKNLSKAEKNLLWNGKEKCKGIYQFFDMLETKKYKIQARVLIARYRGKTSCDACNGSRLRKETNYIKINGKNINDINQLNIKDALYFFTNIKLSKDENIIAKRILEELDKAAKEGKGVAQLDGRMIDAASARMADNVVNIDKLINKK